MSGNGEQPSNSGLGREILPPRGGGQSNSGTGGTQDPAQHQGPARGDTSQGSGPGAQHGNPQDLAQAGPVGAPAGGGGPQPQIGPVTNPAIQNTLADCEVIVDQYRRQRVTKAKALQEIYQKLLATGAGSTLDVETAFSSFLTAVDDHDRQEQGAADRGRAREPGQTRDDAAGMRRSPTPPVLERPGGRSSALEAQYPWAVTEFIESSIQPLSPNLTETLRILKILLLDPKQAKRSILTSARCPEFPDSEWTNLINGRAVNLDAVLSGFFSTTTNDERSESLGGGIELRFGTLAPTKTVSDAGTWTIAFGRLCAATLFIFPHRAKELTEYREYLIALFAATSPIFHDRIISFDKAARKRITQRRDIELTDFSKFMDIKTAVIDAIGVGVVDNQRESSSGAARKPKSQPCNNWNNGRCSVDAGTCRRLHICNVCRIAGHKAPDCPDRPQN